MLTLITFVRTGERALLLLMMMMTALSAAIDIAIGY